MLKSTRILVYGEVWFDDQTVPIINKLIQLQSSAKRSAYQAIHKHKISGNDIKNYVKRNYMKDLNQRYVADACQMAIGITQEESIFGGKKNWKQLITGTLKKEDWIDIRNSQLYSRGDATKNGNPNIRVSGNKLLVNNPSRYGKWIEGKLFIKEKQLVKYVCSDCYDVRLIRKDKNTFNVVASRAHEIDIPIADTSNGVIGIDSNPDGVAVVETDKHGNLIKHFYLYCDRIQHASSNKRDYDIQQLAIKVVDYAKSVNKPIVLELLEKMTKKKSTYKKFNRMRHNFTYRKIITAIKSRAMRNRVSVIDVKPAFTSILGILKYQQMYSLNRHTAAALVIARRGMGITERQTFEANRKEVTKTITVKRKNKKTKKVTDSRLKKTQVSWNLEGRHETIELSDKSWSWLQNCFLKPKPSTLTGFDLVPIERAQDAYAVEIPAGESQLTTGQLCDVFDEDKIFRKLPDILIGEGQSYKVGKFFQL